MEGPPEGDITNIVKTDDININNKEEITEKGPHEDVCLIQILHHLFKNILASWRLLFVL